MSEKGKGFVVYTDKAEVSGWRKLWRSFLNRLCFVRQPLGTSVDRTPTHSPHK